MSFSQLSQIPTVTVIDNIPVYAKFRGYKSIDSRIILSDISDHLPILTCMGKMKEIAGKAPLVFTHIPIDSAQTAQLIQALRSTSWANVLHGVGVSDCYDCVMKYFNTILDEHAHTKTIVIAHRVLGL